MTFFLNLIWAIIAIAALLGLLTLLLMIPTWLYLRLSGIKVRFTPPAIREGLAVAVRDLERQLAEAIKNEKNKK